MSDSSTDRSTASSPEQNDYLPTEQTPDEQNKLNHQPQVTAIAPLRMVETAFLASTASLIFFINFYFPLGPLLRTLFPIPMALVYLRWGNRAAWMSALVSGLLLSVLMGPPRSLLFVMPYALMGVLLGAVWHRRSPWIVSISLGTLLGTIGFFFRVWLTSIVVGQDLWVYLISQVTELAEWGFDKLGLLIQPSVFIIQVVAIASIVLSNLIYLFVVHIAAWLLLERLGNSIPRPPNWVEVLLDYD